MGHFLTPLWLASALLHLKKALCLWTFQPHPPKTQAKQRFGGKRDLKELVPPHCLTGLGAFPCLPCKCSLEEEAQTQPCAGNLLPVSARGRESRLRRGCPSCASSDFWVVGCCKPANERNVPLRGWCPLAETAPTSSCTLASL